MACSTRASASPIKERQPQSYSLHRIKQGFGNGFEETLTIFKSQCLARPTSDIIRAQIQNSSLIICEERERSTK